MKVKALRTGIYENKRVRAGSVFELKEIKGKKYDITTNKLVDHTFKPKDQFSELWMESLEAIASSKGKKPASKKQMSDDSEGEELEVI